eukprot:COSAG06_NODE_2711_length_6401_cov_343.215192_6_plen_40_part_00
MYNVMMNKQMRKLHGRFAKTGSLGDRDTRRFAKTGSGRT